MCTIIMDFQNAFSIANKRLFLGLEIVSLWPLKLPSGRIIPPEGRHLTLLFFGNVSFSSLEPLLREIPPLSFGCTGFFNRCLFLPPGDGRVVAWHVDWLGKKERIESYQRRLHLLFSAAGYTLDARAWLPHVTLCRAPFAPEEWSKDFVQLPFYTSALHLYESKGNLLYEPLRSWSIALPFEEIEHTADIAFRIRGEDFYELYGHAWAALSFQIPELISYFEMPFQLHSLDEVIISLNERLSAADSAEGIGMKAVSFHGEAVWKDSGFYEWEMIVDV